MKPDWLLVAKGLVPDPVIIKDPGMLYVAIGILGTHRRHTALLAPDLLFYFIFFSFFLK